MTDPDIVKYPYKKPDERGIIDEELNIQRNNLLLTLVKIWQDFVDYGPIEMVEKLFKEQWKELDFDEYLNNFDFTIQQAIERKMVPMMGNLNPKTTIFGEHMTNNEKIRHSQKYLEETIEEFRNEIHKAMKICGLDNKKIIKAYKAREKRVDKWKYLDRRNHIYQKIRPLYIQLRKDGYTSYDLTY